MKYLSFGRAYCQSGGVKLFHSGGVKIIIAKLSRRETPGRERFVTSAFHCLHELNQQV